MDTPDPAARPSSRRANVWIALAVGVPAFAVFGMGLYVMFGGYIQN